MNSIYIYIYIFDGRIFCSLLESFFFDFAVPAGACRVFFFFTKNMFFKHHVLTPDSESTQNFV